MSVRNFDYAVYSKNPQFEEEEVRKAFAKAVPLRTVVIYCYDPRAAGVPEAVAREFEEVYPGEIINDSEGRKVASTTSLFEVRVAGGRAHDALRSITVAQHLFGIQNVVVVHHTYCGATTFTFDGIVDAYKREHSRDISRVYPVSSICITDFNKSLEHDTKMLRKGPGTPPHVNIFGYIYDIDTEELIKLVEDRGDGAV